MPCTTLSRQSGFSPKPDLVGSVRPLPRADGLLIWLELPGLLRRFGGVAGYLRGSSQLRGIVASRTREEGVM